MDDADYNGLKDEISAIVDRYVDYILEIGNQADVMEDIVGLIKKNAKTYMQLLSELMKDKTKIANGMRNFVFSNSSEAKDVCEKYGFSTDILFNMLSNALEEERWQWRENEVIEVTGRLSLDLQLVGVVNAALDGSAESVEKVKENLSNYLGYMKVPGCIYTSLVDEWSATVGYLHDISINKWVGFSSNEKKTVIADLQKNMTTAIENITHPLGVLKGYISKAGLGSFSDEEYEEILKELPSEQYSQTEHSFKQNIKAKIKDLDYSKKVKMLLSIWKEKTGTKDIATWTKKYMMPAVWVLPQYTPVFDVLCALGKNERVDMTQLENALVSIKDADLQVLSQQEFIEKCFVVNVASEKYQNILQPHISDVKKTIQDAGCRDYYRWNSDIVKIRKIVEDYISNDLKSEVSDKAKRKIDRLKSVDELKKELNRLIDNSSEACLILLDEDL